MARSVRVATCLTLILAVLFACLPVMGCSPAQGNQARDMLDRADRFLGEIDSELGRLSADIEAVADSAREGAFPTADIVRRSYEALKAQAEEVVSRVNSARAETGKIFAMEGVPDYKKCAEIQNEVLDNAITLVKSAGDVLGLLSVAAATLSSGQAADTAQILRAAEGWSSTFDDIRGMSDKLLQDARNLKEEKDL
ncbi:MAG: hypothetical protein ACYC99_09400 [Candidatus Geothermincolia bacterium]